jgi:hypothetical protein
MKRKTIAMLVILSFVMSSVPAFGSEPKDGIEVAADVLLVRPVSLVALVVGTAMCIVALPFAITSGSTDKAGQLLVLDPLKYTFMRPLGDFDYKVGTAEMPKPAENR